MSVIIDKTGNWQLPFVCSLGLLLLGAALAPIMHPERPFVDMVARRSAQRSGDDVSEAAGH